MLSLSLFFLPPPELEENMPLNMDLIIDFFRLFTGPGAGGGGGGGAARGCCGCLRFGEGGATWRVELARAAAAARKCVGGAALGEEGERSPRAGGAAAGAAGAGGGSAKDEASKSVRHSARSAA